MKPAEGTRPTKSRCLVAHMRPVAAWARDRELQHSLELAPKPKTFRAESYRFDQHKSDYYDRLQYVRERGEIIEWLLFFLDGVAVQAADAVDRTERLSDLRET